MTLKRVYFGVISIFLLVALAVSLRSQFLANEAGRLYLEQGDLVNKQSELINKQLELLSQATDEQIRTDIQLNRIGLEASKISLQLQGIDIALNQSNAYISDMRFLLFSLLLLAFFWTLYYGFIKRET